MILVHFARGQNWFVRRIYQTRRLWISHAVVAVEADLVVFRSKSRSTDLALYLDMLLDASEAELLI
jgi:hypothetical protein